LSWDECLNLIGAKERPRIVHVHVSPYAQRRNAFSKLTKNDLFEEIERVWQAKGRRPTYAEFRKASRFGISVYESHFGGWRKAVEAFSKSKGVPVQGKAGTWATKEVLLDELRAIRRKRPGDLLTYEFYKTNGGTYSRGAFSNHFGNWPNAVKAVGNISGRQARYSTDELFDEMQRLWEQLGRQPNYDDMQKAGKISPQSYHKRFGSWTKAIHAFCEDRNSDSALAAPPLEHLNSIKVSSARDNNNSPVTIPSADADPVVVVHKTGRSVPPRLRWRVFARDDFTCKKCGRSPRKHGVALQADHVTAWTNGGETVLENLQTLCEDCNRGKSNL